jgi:methanogenic corrinoid protein MtbC1
MASEPKPDFERYMTTLHCQEPDRVPLGDWHVEMKNTIVALEEASLRNSVMIIVGGAPVTQAFADEIGADGYGYDSPGAAQKCKELVSG